MFTALSLTLREEHRLRVLQNRVLRRIFGSKRDEATGDLRKLHNEELYNLYIASTSRNPKGLHGLYRDNFAVYGVHYYSNINLLFIYGGNKC
jgi:hypothetical protein